MKEKMLEIIRYNGVIPQLKHFYTEVFELTEAIVLQEEADYDYYEPIDEIIEEITDCFNFLIQFCLYYDISKEDIMKILEYKVDRTYTKVQNGDKI